MSHQPKILEKKNHKPLSKICKFFLFKANEIIESSFHVDLISKHTCQIIKQIKKKNADSEKEDIHCKELHFIAI